MSRYDNRNNTVFIGELKYCARELDLKRIFDTHGPIRRIYISQKGFAFIEYENAVDAHNAIFYLQGLMLYGNVVRVELSKPKYHSKCDCGNYRRYRKLGSIASSRSSNYSRYSSIERCTECDEDGHNERNCRRNRTKPSRSYSSSQFSSIYGDRRSRKWDREPKRSYYRKKRKESYKDKQRNAIGPSLKRYCSY